MARDVDEPLDLDDAERRFINCTAPPGKERGRVWFRIAEAFYRELVRLRGNNAPAAPAPTEEEMLEAYSQYRRPLIEYSICHMTSKRSYASERAAIAATTKTGHKMRTYVCQWCKGYHTTKEHSHG